MQIKTALQRDSDIGGEDEDKVDIPALDWKDERLLINDVFLRFYLRWVHRPVVVAKRAPNPSA
jgi:hypothetical protein